MKYTKYCIPPLISLLMILSYFSPWLTCKCMTWTYEASHTALGFYLLAFFLILFAWIPLLICLVRSIVLKLRGNSKWKINAVWAASIVLYYLAVIIGMANDYIVTV